jgi:hypothetical protein
MTHRLFNSVKKNNSLDLPQSVGSITLTLPISTLIIILIILLCTFICPVPKLLAYSNEAGLSNGLIDRAISIPSPQALIPTSNLHQANSANASQSRSAMNAESVIESFLSPKVLLASAIDQIRNSTTSGDNNLNNGTLGFSASYKTLLLARQIIPPKDFILLFNIPPSGISNGQVFAKLPCNANYTSPLKLFIVETNSGLKIQTRLIDLQVLVAISRPEHTCVYWATVPNTGNIMMRGAINNSVQNTTKSNSGLDPDQTINSIGLLNPTNYQQVLPPTSSLALGFNDTSAYPYHQKKIKLKF